MSSRRRGGSQWEIAVLRGTPRAHKRQRQLRPMMGRDGVGQEGHGRHWIAESALRRPRRCTPSSPCARTSLTAAVARSAMDRLRIRAHGASAYILPSARSPAAESPHERRAISAICWAQSRVEDNSLTWDPTCQWQRRRRQARVRIAAVADSRAPRASESGRDNVGLAGCGCVVGRIGCSRPN
jgi:hypothetical protein